jgi:lipopolysaccharide transport system permease protein
MNKGFSPQQVTIIEPESGWMPLNLREIWQYRDLLQLLVWREISTRYRQSMLGIGWAVFRPLISAMIFTLVFSMMVKVKTDIPYPVFVFSALIPWMYFASCLAAVTNSVSAAQAVLTKVYFPRTILPIAAIGPGLVEVLIQLVILALFMAWYGFAPTWRIVMLPGFIALAVLTAFGVGIWLTALNVKYRDVGMAVPFLVQIWMYLCPIVYPITMVPERFQALYSLNPMVGVIEGFRWSILGTASPHWLAIGCSMAVVLVMLITGLYFFRRVESRFADVI